MVLALLHESDLVLSDDVVETIVDKVSAHFYVIYYLFRVLLSLISIILTNFFPFEDV